MKVEMPVLKTLTALLVIANLAFLAWAQGGLSPWLQPPGASEREPQRLRLQVRPESVIVLSPQAASAAMAPPPPAPVEPTSQGELTDPLPVGSGGGAPASPDRATPGALPVSAGENPRGQGERKQPGR
jgi:hypothetical protein